MSQSSHFTSYLQPTYMWVPILGISQLALKNKECILHGHIDHAKLNLAIYPIHLHLLDPCLNFNFVIERNHRPWTLEILLSSLETLVSLSDLLTHEETVLHSLSRYIIYFTFQFSVIGVHNFHCEILVTQLNLKFRTSSMRRHDYSAYVLRLLYASLHERYTAFYRFSNTACWKIHIFFIITK